MWSMILSPIVSPILPYWLRLRYYVYMYVIRMRREALVEKYRRMYLANLWKTDEFYDLGENDVLEDENNIVAQTSNQKATKSTEEWEALH